MSTFNRIFLVLALLAACCPGVSAQSSRYDELANLPFPNGYPSKEGVATLKDELLFQRGVQSYIWALPALNMVAMKEGSEKVFGKGYNVLPIWKDRLNAKTLVTTPNSDVIYAMGYLDLKADGPMVIEVPPGLQGILDDFFQRPICSERKIEGRIWCGDVGLPGPDHGKGGKYLILPPDYKGDVPREFFALRSRTYGVFVFWRGFFKDPKQLDAPVKVMEKTRIYPLGNKKSAKPMQFPNASNVPANMLYPTDGSAFDMLARFIAHEYVDPADMEMRGMLASLGIIKGKPFKPDAHTRDILDKAARTASRIGHAISYEPQTIVAEWPVVQGPALAQCLPGQRDVHRGNVQLHRSAHRLLHQRLFREPGHGGDHGQRRRQVPGHVRRRQRRFPVGLRVLQAASAEGNSGRTVLVRHRL